MSTASSIASSGSSIDATYGQLKAPSSKMSHAEEYERSHSVDDGAGGENVATSAIAATLIASRRASNGTTATEDETACSSSHTLLSSTSSNSTDSAVERMQRLIHEQQHSHQKAQRRVSFSGTDRVREFNLADSERIMKRDVKREIKKSRRKVQGPIDITLSAEQIARNDGEESSVASSDSGGRGAAQPPDAAQEMARDRGDPTMFDDPFSAERVVSSLFTSSANSSPSDEDGSISSGSASSGSASSGSTSSTLESEALRLIEDANNAHSPRRAQADTSRRRPSMDLLSPSSRLSANASTSTNDKRANPNNQPRRRSSLDLWSAPNTYGTPAADPVSAQLAERALQRRRRSLDALPVGASLDAPSAPPPTTVLEQHGSGDSSSSFSSRQNRPVGGLVTLRQMSTSSRIAAGVSTDKTRRRNSASAGSYTMPLKNNAPRYSRRHSMDALSRALDVDKTVRQRRLSRNNSNSGDLAVQHGEHDGDVVIINGKRMKRQSLRRLSRGMDYESLLDTETEALAARVPERRRSMERDMQARRSSLDFEDEANCMDELEDRFTNLEPASPDYRRDIVKADAGNATLKRRRHSITLIPCTGWEPWAKETTISRSRDVASHQSRSYEDVTLPLIAAAKEKAFDCGLRSEDTSKCDYSSIRTPETEATSGALTSDVSISSSCVVVGREADRIAEGNVSDRVSSDDSIPPVHITIQRRPREKAILRVKSTEDLRRRHSGEKPRRNPRGKVKYSMRRHSSQEVSASARSSGHLGYEIESEFNPSGRPTSSSPTKTKRRHSLGAMAVFNELELADEVDESTNVEETDEKRRLSLSGLVSSLAVEAAADKAPRETPKRSSWNLEVVMDRAARRKPSLNPSA